MFELATKGMSPRQAQEWFRREGLRRYNAKSGKCRSFSDLGPDIPYKNQTRRVTRHRREQFVYELEDDGRGWYHQAHASRLPA